MNALELITSAMRITNALASGETPSAAEAQDGLSILNLMMDSWSAERLMVFTITMQQFTLVPGQQTYTLGTGGDFDYPRPAQIYRYGIVWSGNVGQPLELTLTELTDAQWQALPVKNIQSTIPQYVYDDGAFPFRNLNFWCVPTVADPLRLYMWTPLSTFPDLTTDVTFPPGYEDAIKYSLAVRMATENIGTMVSPMLLQIAANAVSIIKRINIPYIDLQVDPFLSAKGRHYNWISNTMQ